MKNSIVKAFIAITFALSLVVAGAAVANTTVADTTSDVMLVHDGPSHDFETH